ncbi:MAG: hypothetical protein NVSMB60_34110 [Mycobacterium sp.]
MNDVPFGAVVRWALVSGPAITNFEPFHNTSMQPSGKIHDDAPSATRSHTVTASTIDMRSR